MIRISLLITLLLIIPNIHSKEIDLGLLVADKSPSQQSWVQEKNGTWKLCIIFDRAAIFTFFKEKPSKNTFLSLSRKNRPLRQEILFYGEKHPKTLLESQYEQFGDGAVCWSFSTEQNLSRDGQLFKGITTAIIDDPINRNDEYRYCMWRDIE